MLRDDVNARLSVDAGASREADPFLAAVQGAAADDFTVLGEIGRGADGVIIYLSREVASGRLVALRLQREGQLAHEFSLELVRHLDNSMPAPESKCFKCGRPIRGWARFCSYCGADLSGAAPADSNAESAAAMMAALNEAVAGEYEVLGEMARSEGGGAVYFARDRQSNRIVALRLQREGTDDAFSIGETTALKPLAASLGVKPVATQLLGPLVPAPAAPPPVQTAAATPPPPPPPLAAPAKPGAPPPLVARKRMVPRTQLILGAAGAVVLVILALIVFSPDQKPATLPKPVASQDTVGAAPPATVTPPPPPAATGPAPAAAPVPHPTTGTIAVTHVGNDADVHIDGAKWPANKPLRLAAGSHAVTISVPGYQPYSETVQLAVGEAHEVAPQLIVQPKSAASVAPGSGETPRHSNQAAPAALQCEKLVEARNWHDAAQVCTTEAGAGSVVAKRNLGLLYNHGNGVKSSDDDAVRWYKQAVDGGDAMAMFLLGTFYEHGGGGIKKDQATAAQLYARSADGGYVLAQRTMAEAFEKGHLGVEKNKARALDLYRKAAAQGDKAAGDKVKDLEKP